MRLWSIHPSYLDSKGLVALWREALLAQAVLRGKTRGYVNHPQLERFRADHMPLAAIADYLTGVLEEANTRGYSFDRSKIGLSSGNTIIQVTTGQIEFEVRHLSAKLQARALAAHDRLQRERAYRTHRIFVVTNGPVAGFERGARGGIN